MKSQSVVIVLGGHNWFPGKSVGLLPSRRRSFPPIFSSENEFWAPKTITTVLTTLLDFIKRGTFIVPPPVSQVNLNDVFVFFAFTYKNHEYVLLVCEKAIKDVYPDYAVKFNFNIPSESDSNLRVVVVNL